MEINPRQELLPPPGLIDEKFGLLVDDISYQAVSDENDDYTKKFFASLLERVHQPTLKQIYTSVLNARPGLESQHLAQLSLRATQKQLIRHQYELHYPRKFNSTQRWGAVLDDPSLLNLDEFFFDLSSRDIQSNVSQRYVASKALIQLLRPRFGSTVTVMDIGCSLNLGGNKLVTNYSPFRELEVVQSLADLKGPREAARPDALGPKLNQIIDSDLGPAYVHGIDKTPIETEADREWAEACSLKPGERLDERLLEEYLLLSSMEPRRVSFKKMDILDPVEMTYLQTPTDANFEFDVVICSTVMYQFTPAQRKRFYEIARRYVKKPEGIIIYQDFARVNPDPKKRDRLSFYRRWGPGTYRTTVEDMHRPKNLQELFSFESGRAERVALGLGSLCVNGKFQSIRQLIEEHELQVT